MLNCNITIKLYFLLSYKNSFIFVFNAPYFNGANRINIIYKKKSKPKAINCLRKLTERYNVKRRIKKVNT